mgnify:CR=1 FL=1
MRARARSQIISALESVTGVGLKVGIPVSIAAAVYLLVAAFGRNIAELDSLPPADRDYFINGIQVATRALTIAGVAVVVSLIIRLFYEEALGQALALAGAVLYFGTPALFAMVVDTERLSGNALFAGIVSEFRLIGAICLMPGLALILRDAILRIWTGISVRRVTERRWGDEDERRRRHKPRAYGSCWDMPYCREFVRRVCPAWQARTPCWRLKLGCYCDERTILQAMAGYGTDNEHVRGIMHSLGLDKPRQSTLSAAQKRARCRRCGIYAEHQRQKYRLVSPLVIPGVIALMYAFRERVSGWLYTALEHTDRFMRILSYKPEGTTYTFEDGHILTMLAMVWLTIIVISYTLRALEYLLFELQV